MEGLNKKLPRNDQECTLEERVAILAETNGWSQGRAESFVAVQQGYMANEYWKIIDKARRDK